jgi:hypothetical protein
MFDNVTLGIDELSKGYNLFDNDKIKPDKCDPYKGNLKNMTIKQFPNYLKITGSLPKYLRDENITPLKMKEVEQAIMNLEKDIGHSLKNAIVKSAEFGTSVRVKEMACEYMYLFGYTKRLYKDLISYGCINKPFRSLISNRNGLETLTYTTRKGSYKFIVYDKIREVIDHKGVIPPSYEDDNVFHHVLRLEYKIKKRKGIKEQFNRDLTAYDLFNEEVYMKFKKLFIKQYKDIEKMGRLVYVIKPEKSTPKIFTEIAAEQYRQLHPEEYQEHLQRFIEAGKIDLKKNFSLKKELSLKKTIERIKGENNKLGRDNSFSDTNLLIKELDDLVYKSVMLGD